MAVQDVLRSREMKERGVNMDMEKQFQLRFDHLDPIVEPSEYDTEPSPLEELEYLRQLESEQEDLRFIPPRNLWERPKVTITLEVKPK